MPSGIMLSGTMLNGTMLSGVMLSVIVLNVVVSKFHKNLKNATNTESRKRRKVLLPLYCCMQKTQHKQSLKAFINSQT